MNSLTDTILEANESAVDVLLTKESLVEGIDALPNILGLYNNIKKSSAKVILEATYTDITNTSHKIPLYSYWDYGNGMVSTFASTISGNWISKWDSDTLGTKVLSNVPKANKPNERIDSAFIVETLNLGTNTLLNVSAPSLNVNSVLNVKVTNPDNSVVTKELTFKSENYVCELVTDLVCEYVVELIYQLGQAVYTSTYSFTISYLPEYNSFTIFEASNLYYMVSNNGQVSENGKLILTNDNSNEQKYIYDFTSLFMIICVILVVIDVIVRKLTINDIKALFRNKKYYQGGKK